MGKQNRFKNRRRVKFHPPFQKKANNRSGTKLNLSEIKTGQGFISAGIFRISSYIRSPFLKYISLLFFYVETQKNKREILHTAP
ncbi:hypothetical protein D1164_21120 [Mariniphaga sediminis]|uniref:Uncharacterized protein n=1 Tax=Mariniphaga sediminis TaxID=1628158 RepID=A0A399CV09_9BACT|nr:hypothetical protein D1164_21120 [Mariniphaga sediminis]